MNHIVKSIFVQKKKIVANTLDARVPKNKAQYEWFKYHKDRDIFKNVKK